MAQPKWKLLWSTDYTALFEDETGEYEPELMIAQEFDDPKGKTKFLIYRFAVERQREVEDYEGDVYLVPASIADRRATLPHAIHQYQEWYVKSLADVARSVGESKRSLTEALVSADPSTRAMVYEAIGGYHGYDNFDSYPQTWSEKKFDKEWP